MPGLPRPRLPLMDAPPGALWRIVRNIAVGCAVWSLGLPAALAEPPATPEYTLKAAFIYNFARFTTWSERPDKLLHLCILGRDPFGSAIDTIDNKEIGQLRVAVRHLRNAEEAMHTCQIVFITDSELDNFMMQPERVRTASGTLTIADREGAARRGIIIELATIERKIGFEFNQESARHGQVEISSKLLRLARKVY